MGFTLTNQALFQPLIQWEKGDSSTRGLVGLFTSGTVSPSMNFVADGGDFVEATFSGYSRENLDASPASQRTYDDGGYTSYQNYKASKFSPSQNNAIPEIVLGYFVTHYGDSAASSTKEHHLVAAELFDTPITMNDAGDLITLNLRMGVRSINPILGP